MTPWAFIPARAGSKRLPRKALADLGGKPLIAWTAEAARDAGIFEEIVVSADDYAICQAAAHVATLLHERPPQSDDVPLLPSVQAFLADNPHIDCLYVLLPTSPFRTRETIREAWDVFRAAPAAAGLLSVVQTEPPEHTLRVANGFIARTLAFDTHRSQLPPAYRHDGGHQIVTRRTGRTLAFYPPLDETLDINTPDDLELARWRLSRRLANAAAI